MVKLIEGALYIGSAAYLYQGITKQKVLSKQNVRNGTIGALFGLIAGPKLEAIIKNAKELTDDQKKEIFGAVVGGGLGAYIGKEVANGALGNVTGYLKNQVASYKQSSEPQVQE